MIHDCWEQLLSLKTKLLLSPDRTKALGELVPGEGVIEVYADDVEQAMFIVAANRMAELLDIACFRLDIEDGMPQIVFSFGVTVEDAKARMAWLYEVAKQDALRGLESE